MPFPHVSVVGLGQLGGSLAAALVAAGRSARS
jgi:prephenate dehydrogenase